MDQVDLSKRNGDYAVYLPAYSSYMANHLGRAENVPGWLDPRRTPKGFENGFRGSDFLNKDECYYYYDNALYSAGHAYLDMEKSKSIEYPVWERDSNTTLVADSGGFQIGKGVIKFDWENFFEKPGDRGYKGKADAVRSKILTYMENVADWSMTLDVPAWAATIGRERTGLKTFQECLDCTKFNNAWFSDNRLGQTKYLNVLQGTEWDDSQQWYEGVRDFDFEGWGMGGNNMRDMHLALKRLIVMRDDGQLEGKDWIHFLGTSKLEWSVMLTGVQRALRKYVNPNVTISFDAASPYVAAANGRIYTRNILTSKQMSYKMDRLFDGQDFSHFTPNDLAEIPIPWDSPIAQRCDMGDLLWYGPNMPNKRDEVGFTTAWDSMTYCIMMSHNVYKHIASVQEANALAKIEHHRWNLDWRTWDKSKKTKQESQWIPRNILMFLGFVDELFQSNAPMDMLDQARPFLDALSNQKHTDAESSFRNSPASAFFDMEKEDEETDEGEFSAAQEEKLEILEQMAHDEE
jgi:hypothetical protein